MQERSEGGVSQLVVRSNKPTALDQLMVVIVRRFPVSVEDLTHLRLLPSVDELRPSSCPLCGQAACPPGSPLRIVGHGTYRRQVLGRIGECRDLLIWIRRFLCRGCRRTISVLPDGLYPGRWYGVVVILSSLVLALVQGVSAAAIRDRFASSGETRGWKTLERWRRQLLAPLWSWLAGQVGVTGPSQDRGEQHRRLLRLVSLHGAGARSSLDEIAHVARHLVCETAHSRVAGWDMRRGPPG